MKNVKCKMLLFEAFKYRVLPTFTFSKPDIVLRLRCRDIGSGICHEIGHMKFIDSRCHGGHI